jgi:hypothetical protein
MELLKGMARTSGTMGELTPDNGKIPACTVMVNTFGKMERNTLVVTIKTRGMALVFTPGLMVDDTKGIGTWGSSMEKLVISSQAKRRNVEFGITVSLENGKIQWKNGVC